MPATPRRPEALAEPPRRQRLSRAWNPWVAMAACLALAVAAMLAHQRQGVERVREALQRDAQAMAEQIESLGTEGRVMGAAVLLGLVNPEIKQVLAGAIGPDDPALRAVFLAVLAEYQADNLFVLDRTGRTRAYIDRDGNARGLGRDLSVRPYFQRAVAGAVNLYPAVGKNTGERGIYLAAPVRSGPAAGAAVTGAVVIKIGVQRFDALLGRQPHTALLLSPDGVVFGGNRAQWLLHLAEPISAARREALVREEQFGDLFVQGTPQQLPAVALAAGADRVMAEEALPWPAPGKGWRLQLVRERPLAEAWLPSLGVGAGVLALGLFTCAYVLSSQTRRARRAQELRANEARMRGMLEAMPQGVATLDAAGHILSANSALERLAGVTGQALVGQPLSQLLAQQATPAQWLAACQAAPDQMVETQLKPRTGPPIPVGLTMAHFDDGGEQHLLASLRDISARRRAQEAIARELAFQQRLIDTLPNPLFLKDVQGRYTTLNRAFEQAYGVRREEIVGRTVLELDVLDMEAREPMHRYDMALIQDGGMAQGEFSSRWADGRLHQTMFWGQGLADAQGQPAGMVGVILDVSKEVQAHETLRLREQQLRLVLESTPATVIVVDDDGRVLFRNQHALEMFQVDDETLAAKGMRGRYVDLAHRAALFERLKRDGQVRSAEVEMLRGDGTRFWVQTSFSRGSFGQVPDAVFGWSVDVTERKRTAEAMRAAKEAAEATAAAKSSFLANMSHEIRTPMNAIIGLAHLTLQTRLTEQQREYVQKTHHAARALLGVVNDILDFSHMEAGRLEIAQADFDLDTLLAQVAQQAGEKVGDKPLELLFDIDPAVPRQLCGDATRLGQVLDKLLTNAVKFTAQGEIELCCRYRMVAGGPLVLALSVRDTGIGMTPEQMAGMFTPFRQADGSATRRFGGTGLGLSICKRLVDAAGGAIKVDSTPGEGTQFSLDWPCTLAAGDQPPPLPPVALQAVLAQLARDRQRPAPETPRPAGLGDPQARTELARLCAMLEHMDSEAPQQLERLEPWLRQQLPAADMLALWRHVRQYDLDEALALLQQAPALARWHGAGGQPEAQA